MKIKRISQTEDWYTEEVAKNPNTSPDILRKILERGNNDYVSGYAAQNPNCPPLDKIKWMRAVGKIITEDPSKHEIEKVEEPVDEDLEKLKSLISKNNFNLKQYKTAR